jgi:hypothetical protein
MKSLFGSYYFSAFYFRALYFRGIAEPVIPPILYPQIMMRYSIDRGKTWSYEDWQQVGGNFSYEGRTRWVSLSAAYGISFWYRTVSDKYVSWRMQRLRAQ